MQHAEVMDLEANYKKSIGQFSKNQETTSLATEGDPITITTTRKLHYFSLFTPLHILESNRVAFSPTPVARGPPTCSITIRHLQFLRHVLCSQPSTYASTGAQNTPATTTAQFLALHRTISSSSSSSSSIACPFPTDTLAHRNPHSPPSVQGILDDGGSEVENLIEWDPELRKLGRCVRFMPGYGDVEVMLPRPIIPTIDFGIGLQQMHASTTQSCFSEAHMAAHGRLVPSSWRRTKAPDSLAQQTSSHTPGYYKDGDAPQVVEPRVASFIH
ncbi:hypothetical protein DFH27DRAFT_529602 [Peziza echinospora]|nr:hypothetical protein DFH27DRAFT_529602 [Peziza echinospora]